MAKKCHKTILLHLLWKWWPLFLNSWSECQASWATKELSWVHVRIRSSDESRVWIIKCSYSPTSQVWGIPSRHPRAIYLYTDNRHITNDILHNLGEAPPTPAFWWAATEYKLLYYHAYFMLSLPFVFPERNRVTQGSSFSQFSGVIWSQSHAGTSTLQLRISTPRLASQR